MGRHTEAKDEKKKKGGGNKITGLFFSSNEALSREKSFKTAVFPGSSDN